MSNDKRYIARLVSMIQQGKIPSDEEAMRWADAYCVGDELSPAQRFVEWIIARPHRRDGITRSLTIAECVANQPSAVQLFYDQELTGEDAFTDDELRKLAAVVSYPQMLADAKSTPEWREYRVTWTQCPTNDHFEKVLFVRTPSRQNVTTIATNYIERTYGIGRFIIHSFCLCAVIPEGSAVG